MSAVGLNQNLPVPIRTLPIKLKKEHGDIFVPEATVTAIAHLRHPRLLKHLMALLRLQRLLKRQRQATAHRKLRLPRPQDPHTVPHPRLRLLRRQSLRMELL